MMPHKIQQPEPEDENFDDVNVEIPDEHSLVLHKKPPAIKK
jgi:hypothetical protein